jgi:U6 snRNA-associated Sm-like protein LSm7
MSASQQSTTNKPAAAKQSVGSTLPKKESILELSKLQDQVVRVKCLGGRELQGVLRGYDELVNLVLDECDEFLRGTRVYNHIIIYLVCKRRASNGFFEHL